MKSTQLHRPVKGKFLQFGRDLFLQVEDATSRLLMAPVVMSDLRSHKAAKAALHRTTGLDVPLPARRWDAFVNEAWQEGQAI